MDDTKRPELSSRIAAAKVEEIKKLTKIYEENLLIRRMATGTFLSVAISFSGASDFESIFQSKQIDDYAVYIKMCCVEMGLYKTFELCILF